MSKRRKTAAAAPATDLVRLTPDAFAAVADAVYYRCGCKSWERFLLAVEGEKRCKKMVRNYAAKMVIRFQWRKGLDLGSPAARLRTARVSLVRTICSVGRVSHLPPPCFRCGRTGANRLRPNIRREVEVDENAQCCMDCWNALFPGYFAPEPKCSCKRTYFRCAERLGCAACSLEMFGVYSLYQPWDGSGVSKRDLANALRIVSILTQLASAELHGPSTESTRRLALDAIFTGVRSIPLDTADDRVQELFCAAVSATSVSEEAWAILRRWRVPLLCAATVPAKKNL